MKPLIFALFTVVVCALTGWFAHSIGYERGFNQALVLQNGVFIGTLDAAEKLRAGDVDAGTREVERLCFSAADTVYSGLPNSQFVAKTFLQELKQYRQTYRTNDSEWTITEKNLERKLALSK